MTAPTMPPMPTPKTPAVQATQPLRSTPSRVFVAAIGVPLMLAAIAWGAFTAVGLLARTNEHHHVSYPFSGGTVSLNVGDGNVQIRGGDTSLVDVSYTEHFGFKHPTVSGAATASGVSISGHCPGGLFGQNCTINYVITVPKAAALQLRVSDGSLTLQGISGTVVAHVGDGAVHGTQLSSKSVDATVGDGSVHLEWVTGPTRVTSRVGDGSVNISVPRGSGPYAIQHSGSGSTNIAVATDPAAASTMNFHVGDGSIHVGYGN
jgi:hypothetical protein